jgi:hypothetical protein
MADEIVIGVFTKEKETLNTVRYSRENELGRKETQYVPKSKLEGIGTPKQIEVVVRAKA